MWTAGSSTSPFSQSKQFCSFPNRAYPFCKTALSEVLHLTHFSKIKSPGDVKRFFFQPFYALFFYRGVLVNSFLPVGVFPRMLENFLLLISVSFILFLCSLGHTCKTPTHCAVSSVPRMFYL